MKSKTVRLVRVQKNRYPQVFWNEVIRALTVLGILAGAIYLSTL